MLYTVPPLEQMQFLGREIQSVLLITALTIFAINVISTILACPAATFAATTLSFADTFNLVATVVVQTSFFGKTIDSTFDIAVKIK
jgi:ABC-type phosphate/phosphonate transport system permease subunit